MTQKGLVPVLIILLIALSLGGYFVYQNQSKSVPFQQTIQSSSSTSTNSTSNDTDESANWKTYTNSEYAFTLNYPPKMNIINEGPTEGRIGPQWQVSWANTSKEESAKRGSDYGISIEVTINAKNIRGESITKDNLSTLYQSGDSAFKIETSTIQGRPTIRSEATNLNNPSLEYSILDTSSLIRIYGYSKNSAIFSIEDIKKILSTFKFVK